MKSVLSLERYVVLYLLLSAAFCCCALFTNSQTLEFSKTYYNITKGMNGGTVETGDTLEIRATISVRAGAFDSCAFYDVVPSGTSFVPQSIRILTNEGKIYKQFTDAAGDDCGWLSGSNIRINLGYNLLPATSYNRGRIASSDKPSSYGSACIMIASYRIRVTSAFNTTISIGGGSMTYRSGINPVQTFTFPNNLVRVFRNESTCTGLQGPNVHSAETGGTFGTGRPRNRSTSTTIVPLGYNMQPVDIGTPFDYSYSLSNNTSTRQNYTTLNTWSKPDLSSPSHRVFNLWDVIGDHTGSLTSTGNPPADTVTNMNGGYMLIVNPAYRADSFYQQTITGLCANTTYRISCWIRNLCSKCGTDSNGKEATNSSGPVYYIPTAPGDSSGVYPNIAFEINGVDHYTTGGIPYSGKWVEKSFMYVTGSTQTTMTIKMFNNAPGGGGNDFAIDDISVNICAPVMEYGPSTFPMLCSENAFVLSDTIRALYDNYLYYVWQKSTNDGINWSNITSLSGPSSATWNGTAYEYVTNYTLTPTNTELADSGDMYRVVVAGTIINLSASACRFTDTTNITLNILDCGIPLGITFLDFKGEINNGDAYLQWATGIEKEQYVYEVERSTDGVKFVYVGSINSYFKTSTENNHYSFLDPSPPGTHFYYRIKVRNITGEISYSRTIQLSIRPLPFDLITVINPFNYRLRFDISSSENGPVNVELVNSSGISVRKTGISLVAGMNRLSIDQTTDLPAGVYFLVIRKGEKQLRRTVLKSHR